MNRSSSIYKLIVQLWWEYKELFMYESVTENLKCISMAADTKKKNLLCSYNSCINDLKITGFISQHH